MDVNISLPCEDAYQRVFAGFQAQLASVVLGVFNIVIGGYVSFLIIRADFKIIEHRGTLVSLLWGYHDIMLGTLGPIMSLPFILRVVVGPLNDIGMMLVVLSFQFVIFQCSLVYNEIFSVRILLALYFKSAFALEENFFIHFFIVLNFYTSCLYVIGLWIWGGYRTQYFYFMLGQDLTFPWAKPLFSGGHILAATFISAQFMYIVIVAYRTMTRFKDQIAHRKFKQFMWQILKMLAIILCFFIPAKYRNMYPAQDWENQPVLFLILNFGTPFGVGVVLPLTRYLEQVRGYF